MQSAAIGSQVGATQIRSFASRRARLLASASFLVVGLAIGNWPAHAQTTLPSTGTRAVPAYAGVAGPITVTVQ